MTFSKDTKFSINLGGMAFDASFKTFNDIVKEFTESSIIMDIHKIPLSKNSKFKQQFEIGAGLIKSKQFNYLSFPIHKHADDWIKIIEMERLFNPVQTFVIIQFVYFLSKKFPDLAVDFVVGNRDAYTRFVKLLDGDLVAKLEEQIINPEDLDEGLLQLTINDLEVILNHLHKQS